MRSWIILLITFLSYNLLAQDTTITVIVYKSFLPGPYSVQSTFDIVNNKPDYFVNIKSYKRDRYFKKNVEFDTLIAKSNRKVHIYNTLYEVIKHQYDPKLLFFIDLDTWKHLDSIVLNNKYYGLVVSEVDSAIQANGACIKINTSRTREYRYKAGCIDGSYLSVKIYIKSFNYIDSIQLEGNTSCNFLPDCYNQNWFLIHSILCKANVLDEVIPLLGVDDFLCSKDHFYNIILNHIHDTKYTIQDTFHQVIFYDTTTHYVRIILEKDTSTSGKLEIYKETENTSDLELVFNGLIIPATNNYIELTKGVYRMRYFSSSFVYFQNYTIK